ncbi:MAG TPA: RNA-binding S4 domain-containing protein [Caulobacteraceae bacterium]|nr:RNA-binding S4 domain-containing protein [Caulobacteraceae bacterium]
MAEPANEAAEVGVRADVWLWRARFFKTRSMAARVVAQGRVRLCRGGATTRLEKPSRALRPGDELVFALAGRLTSVRVLALGERRGPPAEARALYSPVLESTGSAVSEGRPALSARH